jgi:tRNA(fMet)-specific endonuclease VapC
MFLLDTDHISILQHASGNEFVRMSARMKTYPVAALFFSVVSFHEQVLGWNTYISKARTVENLLRGYRGYEEMISQYRSAQVLPYNQAAVKSFESLRSQRVRIGTFDLRIAAIALSRSFILLSRNLSDFRQVPGLQIQDWTT